MVEHLTKTRRKQGATRQRSFCLVRVIGRKVIGEDRGGLGLRKRVENKGREEKKNERSDWAWFQWVVGGPGFWGGGGPDWPVRARSWGLFFLLLCARLEVLVHTIFSLPSTRTNGN